MTSTGNARLLKVLDRLAHNGTQDVDLVQTVAGFRRMLDGKTPSTIFARRASASGGVWKARAQQFSRDCVELQREVSRLKEQLSVQQQVERRSRATSSAKPASDDRWFTFGP